MEVLVAQGAKQRALEELLGLSGGYLSKLRGGKETSTVLATCLMMLARDPSRISEVREEWRMISSGTKVVTASSSQAIPAATVL